MSVPQYLFHYYEMENGPFHNITELGYEKAEHIQNQIRKGFNSKRPKDYISLRFALERKIREQFILNGGRPIKKAPFYFTLGACEWAKSWYGNPGVIKIPLAKFKMEHISFTYPDSMVSFQLYEEEKLKLYRKNCNGRVFLVHELEALITRYGLPTEVRSQSEEISKYDKYIEAQVWDDSVIREYKT